MNDVTCIFCINPKADNVNDIYKHFDNYYDYITLNAIFTMFWLYVVFPYAKKIKDGELLLKVTSSWDEDVFNQIKTGNKGIPYNELYKLMEVIKKLNEHKKELIKFSETAEILKEDKSRFERSYDNNSVNLATKHYLIEHDFFSDLLNYFGNLNEQDIFIISVGE